MTPRLAAHLLWLADLTARQFTLKAEGERLRWTVTPQFAKGEPDLCRVIVGALRTKKAEILPLLADSVFGEFVALARRVHTDHRRGFVELFCQRIAAHVATGKSQSEAKRAALEDCCNVVIEAKEALVPEGSR